VLRHQIQSQLTEVMLQKLPGPTADDRHFIALIRRQSPQYFRHPFIRQSLLRSSCQGNERPVIIEDQGPTFGDAKLPRQKIPSVFRQHFVGSQLIRRRQILQRMQKDPAPAMHIVFLHTVPHSPDPLPLLLLGHGQGLLNRFGHFFPAIGVDNQGFRQFARRAGHFTKNQHSVVPSPGSDKFLRHQIHSIAQRRDQRDIRGGIKRTQRLQSQIFI